MHFKLYKILSNIAELLMLYAVNRITIEQLHKYVCDDIDMFIKLNSGIFDHNIEFTPSPRGDER